MISVLRPTTAVIGAFLARNREVPFSYSEVGATRDEVPPVGYTIDHRRVLVGHGERVFHAACECARRWDVFNFGWISMCWPSSRPEPGVVVATLVRALGMWWLNPCRVVYVEETSRQLRFAYGTTTDHFASGEERFTIEWLEDDSVWYDLYAFSRPYNWLARSGYPVMRWLQKLAGDQSMGAFALAVQRKML